jgi:hypothetical protein
MSPATGPEDQRSTTNPWGYLPGWSNWTGGDELERVPELQWPMATTTYQYMMNDAQIFSLIMSLILPIRSWRWHLKKNGAQDAIVQRISADYNLPIEDDMEFNRRRGQRRFSFDKHLEDALRAVYLGYYPFEQVGDILPEDLKWHLRKLAPIPPRTLSEITLAADGGLDWIKQLTAKATDPADQHRSPRLVRVGSRGGQLDRAFDVPVRLPQPSRQGQGASCWSDQYRESRRNPIRTGC